MSGEREGRKDRVRGAIWLFVAIMQKATFILCPVFYLAKVDETRRVTMAGVNLRELILRTKRELQMLRVAG